MISFSTECNTCLYSFILRGMSDLVLQTTVYSFILRGMSDLVLYTESNTCKLYSFILRGMSDLVLYTERNEWLVFIHLLFLYTERNEWTLVLFLYTGMSDLVVQLVFIFIPLYWFLYRNEWFSCATLVFLYTERNEWFSCAYTCVYSFILRGMSDLVVVQHLSFIPLYWEEWVI